MYHYEDGTTRWRRFNGRGDVHACHAPRGWQASADLIDVHPVTGKYLGVSAGGSRKSEAGHGKA
ncbi:MAG: hypothetical protein IPL15_00085 [Comamonadaceae bacterium]|uniref:hypothetical protein n=1 Tax=Candidatus Skiveiella danica TaxID=3386177 RepID=UPI00390AF785|nr:hypothetical protein [Comamonadaceae bacterium]